MKTIEKMLRPSRGLLPLISLTCGLAFSSLAQTNTLMPVVDIFATDPSATWSGDTATFTVLRRGNPTNALNVFYRILGTATNGVDYQLISNSVPIPSGATSNTIVITPINNGQTNVRTVTLVLTQPPFLPPVNYVIGFYSNATAFIRPTLGSNVPPVVRITSPPNGAVFRAPVNIPLFAYAADFDGFVSSVEFFANGNSLGQAHRLIPSPTPWPPIAVSNTWSLIWCNPPPVTNAVLTAVATDNGGLSTTSAPITISVLPPLPPPTNRPPILSIIATDPIAIEGTNCWPRLGFPPVACTWSNWFGWGSNWVWFTNCGPKNATLTVRRFGDTNDDLTVTYNIGGTATNGVDYVALPGSVTVPAGQRRADISIVPIDDGAPDITSTVILRLTPGTNYVLGLPRAAGALILDSRSPHATTGLVAGQSFNLAATGPDGAWYHVEYSTDMVNWTPISTNQVINGAIDFVDPDGASTPARFYRAVPEAGPPLE
jgi:hypothetical protein